MTPKKVKFVQIAVSVSDDHGLTLVGLSDNGECYLTRGSDIAGKGSDCWSKIESPNEE